MKIEIMTDRPTETDRQGQREVSLPINYLTNIGKEIKRTRLTGSDLIFTTVSMEFIRSKDAVGSGY